MPEKTRALSSNRARLFLLTLLIVSGFLVRVVGTASSVAYIPDTQIIREGLQMGQEIAGDRGVLEVKYPFTLPLYLLVTYSILLAVQLLTGAVTSLDGFMAYLFANREAIHMLSVWSLNVINVGIIPLIFLLSRRINPRHSGWLAAGMATFNLLLVHFSHHARPHVPLTTLSTLAVFLLIEVAHNGGWKWGLAAAVISALTVGTLQNGIIIAAPFALAFFVRAFDAKGKFSLRVFFSGMTIVCALIFAVLSLLLSPALVSELAGIVMGTLQGGDTIIQLGQGSHAFTPSQFMLDMVPIFIRYIFSYQPFLTVIFPFALAYLIWRLRRQIKLLVVLLPFPIINLVMWALYEGTSPRVLAVTVPLLILAGAFLIEDVSAFAAARLKLPIRAVLIPVSLAILIPTIALSLRFAYVSIQADTRTQASQWIESAVPAGSTILTNFAALELTPTRASLERQAAAYPESLGTQNQWLLSQPDSAFQAPAFDLINNLIYRHPYDESAAIFQSPHYALLYSRTNFYFEFSPSVAFYMANAELLQLFCPGIPLDYTYLPEDLTRMGWRDIWMVDHPGTITFVFRYEPSSQPLITPEAWIAQADHQAVACRES